MTEKKGNRRSLNVLEVQKDYCELIFKKDWDPPSDERNLKTVIQNINTLSQGNFWSVPYQLITQKIYESNDLSEYEVIKNSITERLSMADEVPEELLGKTLRHIQLAMVQKKYINKNIKLANDELEEIQDTKSKIYTDFITILGIFTAITFATFGGLQLIGDVLKGVAGSVNATEIGGVLIVSAVILLATYLILIALMVGLSKLISGSNEKRYKFTGIVTFCIILVIVILFTVGCVFYFKG